jgi:hypothetical protein
MTADSDATHTRTGRTKRYTWSETVHEIELRLPLPVGTKRSQLAITLHDDASGANLWRTEIETTGGRENYAERALLRVRPAFWPDPLVDGVVRGAVDPLESSYQLVATGGSDAWDCLVISLRKAESAKGWWGGVVHDEAPADAEWPAAAAAGGGDLPRDAARLVQLMATSLDNAELACRCAEALAALADAGRSAELLAAKALAQLTSTMRAQPGLAALQAAGCAVLARAPMSVDAPPGTTEAVLTSQLLGAALSAVLRHPASPLVQLHGAHAMLNTARGGEALATALLKGEGGALLAAMLQQPAPVCDTACAALGSLARLGPKAVAALVHQGAAAALISAAASSPRGAQWRARCASVVFGLCEATDAMVLRALLAAGLVPTLVALCAADDADERTRVRAAHAIGALSWRGSSSVLRQQVKLALRTARASRALVLACGAHPRRLALRVGCMLLLGELSAPAPVEEKQLSPEGEERLRRGELMPIKRAPAVPVPKMPSKKPAAEEAEGVEAGAEVLGAAAATGQPGSGGMWGSGGLWGSGGVSEAGNSQGAVGIGEADALNMVRDAEEESEALSTALEGSSDEIWELLDLEARFLVGFLRREVVGGVGDDGEGGETHKAMVRAEKTTAPIEDSRMSSSSSSGSGSSSSSSGSGSSSSSSGGGGGGSSTVLLAARMQASADTAAALAHEDALELDACTAAAKLLEMESARDHARSLAVTVLQRMAAQGEAQRAALVRHDAISVAVAALPATARWGERQAQLCAALAHLSCTAAEQAALLACPNVIAELAETYEDALVAGLDAASHRLRAEIGILLSNLAAGADGSAEVGMRASGAGEALDEARAEGTSLAALTHQRVLEALETAPHHGALLMSACTLFGAVIERAAMLASQAQAADDLVDLGVLKVVATGLRRHVHSGAVAGASLKLLAMLCRWQPRAALLLRRLHAVQPCLDIVQRALTTALHGAHDGAPFPLMLAACDLVHALATAQGIMPRLPPLSLPLDLAEAVPLLLRAAAGATSAHALASTAERRAGWALVARHARQAVSWLAVSAGGQGAGGQGAWAWAAAHDPDGALAALGEPLSTDCSILGAESLGRALHAAPTHTRLLHDASAELHKQLTRRHRRLLPARLLGLGLVQTLVAAVRELGDGRPLGVHTPPPLPLPLRMSLAPTTAPAAAAASLGPIGLAIDSVLALFAALSDDDAGLAELSRCGALPTLLPYMATPTPPPKALLHGSLLLANALRLRSAGGSLEQRAAAERERRREELEGTRAVLEAERAALLDAALPVLLRIMRLHVDADASALSLTLDALRKLATNPGASACLRRHGALETALELAIHWPEKAAAQSATELAELARLLLLAAAHDDALGGAPNSALMLPTPPRPTPPLSAKDAEDKGEEGEVEEAPLGEVWPPLPPLAPVALHAGAKLGGLLSWVARASELYPPPDILTDEEKTQRALCRLLDALLCTAPADAAVGHAELEALPPLLALMRTQRADAELQAVACARLHALAGTSAHLAKQLARVGAIKTLLLTMRAHLKAEEVQEHAAGILRAIVSASDGCRTLVVEGHGIPMLAVMMKKHTLCMPVQRDGAAALGTLCVHSEAGLAALAKEKEGVEVLVCAMLLCAREKVPFEQAKAALKALADAEPALLKRIERANGKRWLREPPAPVDVPTGARAAPLPAVETENILLPRSVL